jgi:hypothetical protein
MLLISRSDEAKAGKGSCQRARHPPPKKKKTLPATHTQPRGPLTVVVQLADEGVEGGGAAVHVQHLLLKPGCMEGRGGGGATTHKMWGLQGKKLVQPQAGPKARGLSPQQTRMHAGPERVVTGSGREGARWGEGRVAVETAALARVVELQCSLSLSPLHVENEKPSARLRPRHHGRLHHKQHVEELLGAKGDGKQGAGWGGLAGECGAGAGGEPAPSRGHC